MCFNVRTRKFLFIIAFACLALAVSACKSKQDTKGPDAQTLSTRIKASKSGDNLHLKDNTSFPWELVYIFQPYTPVDVIYDIIGFKANIPETIESSDNINLLVFVSGKKIVGILEYPRSQGDFSPVARKLTNPKSQGKIGPGLTPEQAVFEIIHPDQAGAGLWAEIHLADQ